MVTGLRVIGAIAAATFVALFFIVAVEIFSAVVHPMPAGFDGSMEEICEHVARYPTWVLALVVLAWGFTAWLSTWIAQRIGGSGPAIFIGMILVVAVIYNVSILPYPLWFKFVIVITILTSVLLGCQLPKTLTDRSNND